MQRKGCIHIYCGDGKGKTTAAVGLAVRAAGQEYQILFAQFLKDNSSGERKSMALLPQISLMQGKEQEKFVFRMSEPEKEEARCYYRQMLANIKEHAERYDMIVLDEIICAVQTGIIEEKTLLAFLAEKPMETEIILTGNTPSTKLLAMADYVTRMEKLKHPYDQGSQARKGIEF